MHVDQSEKDAQDGVRYTAVFAGDRKNDLNPHEPISSEAHAFLKAEVNRIYGLFVETVARHRGIEASAVRDTEAGLFFGQAAVAMGLADAIGRHLLEIVEFEGASGPFAFAAMAAIGMAVALVTCLPAAPAIMTPLAAAIAAKSGWALDSVLMAQVPTWIVFPLPYQAPPLLVALSLGAIAIPRVLPLMASYFAFGVVVILPLQYLWGHFLGVYG